MLYHILMQHFDQNLKVLCRPNTTIRVPPIFLNKSLYVISNCPRDVIETLIKIKIIENPNTNPKDLYKVKNLVLSFFNSSIEEPVK